MHSVTGKHRDDIDGLRAFAILPVILFHAGFTFFSGGYFGVDVFFTISGYLITLILLREIENGTFSYAAFLKRRIRRLMPMAILIYLFVLIVFMFIYPTVHFQKVAATTITSLVFLSNFYFWRAGGAYFGDTLEINPLLHTWSLSVEEQFYLIFPFLLIVLFWFTRFAAKHIFRLTLGFHTSIAQSEFIVAIRMFLLTLGIVFSLVVAVYYGPTRDSFAAYYLLPPRMYELGIGALGAFFVYYWPNHPLRETKFLQEIGFVLILVPVLVFDEDTLFPSYKALFPCMGALFVMLSTRRTGWAASILQSKVAVFLGLISYSLYLWHWPLIVMKNWFTDNESNVVINMLVLLLSVLLSAITYKLVETPFRNKAAIPDKPLLISAGASFALVGLLGSVLYFQGNSAIVDPDLELDGVYQRAVAAAPNRAECFEKVRLTGEFQSCSLPGNATGESAKNIFVWGDSHGSAFMPSLSELSEKHNVVFSNNSGCPPVIDLKRIDYLQSCPRISQQIFDHIIDADYDLVVLVGAFSNYLNHGMVGHLDAKPGKNIANALNDFSELMPATLSRFEEMDLPFLIFVQPPRMAKHVPEAFLRAGTLGASPEPETISLAEYEKQIEPLYQAIPEQWHHTMINLSSLYCPDNVCVSMRDGKLLYKDPHHISNDYTKIIAKPVQAAIEQVLDR